VGEKTRGIRWRRKERIRDSGFWAGLELAIKRHGLHLWRSPTQIGAHYMDCTNNVKVFGKWPHTIHPLFVKFPPI
jgi:hypothetical protein